MNREQALSQLLCCLIARVEVMPCPCCRLNVLWCSRDDDCENAPDCQCPVRCAECDRLIENEQAEPHPGYGPGAFAFRCVGGCLARPAPAVSAPTGLLPVPAGEVR